MPSFWQPLLGCARPHAAVRGPPLPHTLSRGTLQVLVALEPVVQGVGDDIGRMREVARDQRVDPGQRGLQRGSPQHLVPPTVRELVLELGFAGQHARGEWLTARGIGRVLDLPLQDGTHGVSDHACDGGGWVSHSRIAWAPGRSTWTLSSTEVTQVSGM